MVGKLCLEPIGGVDPAHAGADDDNIKRTRVRRHAVVKSLAYLKPDSFLSFRDPRVGGISRDLRWIDREETTGALNP